MVGSVVEREGKEGEREEGRGGEVFGERAWGALGEGGAGLLGPSLYTIFSAQDFHPSWQTPNGASEPGSSIIFFCVVFSTPTLSYYSE